MFIVIEKVTQTYLVHPLTLGKRQALSGKATRSLPQAEVPSFYLSSQSAFFTSRSLLLGSDDQLVCFPEITKAVTVAIQRCDSLPKLSTTGFASICDTYATT
jgi:hypothetical protein